MTDEEVNKIIAEYMGWYEEQHLNHGLCWNHSDIGDRDVLDFCPNFISLDALVPVWEKLMKNDDVFVNKMQINMNFFQLSKRVLNTKQDHRDFAFFEYYGETIQDAAANATAKSIKELDAL